MTNILEICNSVRSKNYQISEIFEKLEHIGNQGVTFWTKRIRPKCDPPVFDVPKYFGNLIIFTSHAIGDFQKCLSLAIFRPYVQGELQSLIISYKARTKR
jgi:hypothetical protein